MVLFSILIFSCSIPQPSIELQNPYYFTHNHQPDADKQEVTAVYSVLHHSEGYSSSVVEQHEYSVLKKPEKQHFSSEEKKVQPQPTNGSENPDACLNQECQKMSPSDELTPIYAQPDLSKKRKPHSPLLSTTESTNESPPPIPPKAEEL